MVASAQERRRALDQCGDVDLFDYGKELLGEAIASGLVEQFVGQRIGVVASGNGELKCG